MTPFDTSARIILENDRVLLRPLTKEDMVYLLPFAEKEPELWTFSLQSAAGESNMMSYIETALANRQAGNSYPFIVYDKGSLSYAGSTRFYDIQEKNDSLQLGFTWYGRNFQGTGINANCKFLMLEYAFEKIGMERVEFRADYKNKRSIAAMNKIGCVEEGVLRQNVPDLNNQRRDSIILSILRAEWKTKVKAHLSNML